jgi:RHS repeat-associated protein
LIGVASGGNPAQHIIYAYDGIGRRVAMAVGPSKSILRTFTWCGSNLCQARDAGYSVERSYLPEGEYAASDSHSLFYGVDQIGSIRRVFEANVSLPPYDYDAWGMALAADLPLTDVGFARMFIGRNGEWLTAHRPYSPLTARWLSRDPAGERTDRARNLFTYVNNNPVRKAHS